MTNFFEAEFPIWTLADKTLFEEKGLPEAIALLRDSEGRILPLFTDTNLAERFIAACSMDNVQPVPIESSASLHE